MHRVVHLVFAGLGYAPSMMVLRELERHNGRDG
jgi:hypothetical protein